MSGINTRVIQWMYQHGQTFEDILLLGIPYYRVLQSLYYCYMDTKDQFYKEEYQTHCAQVNICDQKIMIIGDTHMGGKFENSDYVANAFAIANEQGIHTILHGGDIGDGVVDPVLSYSNSEKQIAHIIEDYPKDSNITHILILGNHDKNYSKTLMETLIKKREDIKLLGVNIGYINIFSHLISLEHGYMAENRPNWFPTPEIRLLAHYHKMNLTPSKIELPALCENMFWGADQEKYRPGFLILNIEEGKDCDVFTFEGYQFKGKAEKTQEKSFTYQKK